MRKISILFAGCIIGILRPGVARAYDTPETKTCDVAPGACIMGDDSAGGAAGVQGNGGVGVFGQATASGGLGVVGWQIHGNGNAVEGDASGGNSTGVYGSNTSSTSGYAVFGEGDQSYGIWGHSNAKDGVHGDVNNSWSAVAGVNSGSGPGVYAASGTGYGVQAYGGTNNWAVAAWGAAGGVYGSSANTNSYGVYGTTSANDSYGVYATTSGSSDVGVYGHTTGDYSYALQGLASGNSTAGVIAATQCTGGTCYGVYGSVGSCAAGATCYGVYSNGNTYLGGNIYGWGTNYYTSDQRLKKDIEPLRGDSLNKLLQLHGVSFRWKEPSKHGDQMGIQRGFIAQDYEEVFPEWVTTDKDGYKMISTTGLDSLEVESIRQLKQDNDDLRKRIDALEAGRRPLVSMNAMWGWMAGLALAGAVVVGSRRKSKDHDSGK